MASITNSTWSLVILSPTATSTRTIFPGVGAGISIADAAVAGGGETRVFSETGAAETVPPELTWTWYLCPSQ